MDHVVAHECHIVAETEDGPRGVSPLTAEERDSYPNLILMCMEHHKIIDDDPTTWPVDRLLELKAHHEAHIEAMLTADEKQAVEVELVYARIVGDWEQRVQLAEWRAWTSWLNAPTPELPEKTFRDRAAAAEWLFTRSWPGTHHRLERALESFRRVLADLTTAIAYGLESDGETRRLVPAYHKRWVENYDDLANEFNWSVDLIHDLVFELTRCANWICDEVRAALDPLYRLDEGVLVVERQDVGFFSKVFKPSYGAAERTGAGNLPYESLKHFLDAREGRDVSFGEGLNRGAIAKLRPVRVGPPEF